MAEQQQQQQQPTTTTIMDLNMDSLIHVTSYLSIQDVSNMAMSSKFLKNVANSDYIWQSIYRARWSSPISHCFSQEPCFRNSYLARHTSTQQFKFQDPLIASFDYSLKSQDHLLLLEDDLIFSKGRLIHMLMGCNSGGCDSGLTLVDHHARITSMRLYSMGDVPVTSNSVQSGSAVLATSSCDHTIRLWSKGSCYRCFRGHNGEVTTLSDKTLGNGIFASGGVDGTVRLWSINSKGNKGKHVRKALYGHEKPVTHMAVAAHKSSLLISMSKDSKMRVWDTTCSSVRSSCCVGMTLLRGAGAPMGMKCHEALVYVAAGSSVFGIDLRTMREVFRVPNQTELHSFDIIPSKSLICMGRTGSVTLGDMRRRSSDTYKAVPVAELDAHSGAVKHLHADAYKIVTGGPEDSYVKVWESNTGALANTFTCGPEPEAAAFGCSAVATKGSRIVIAGTDGVHGSLRYIDFENATCPTSCQSSSPYSKFWGSDSNSDSDDDFDDDDVD